MGQKTDERMTGRVQVTSSRLERSRYGALGVRVRSLRRMSLCSSTGGGGVIVLLLFYCYYGEM